MDILIPMVVGVVTGVIANFVYDWLCHRSSR